MTTGRVNTNRGLLHEDEVRPGDQIRTSTGTATVTAIHPVPSSRRVRVVLRGCIDLILPANRLVRSRGGWIRAEDLRAEDSAYTSTAPGLFGTKTDLQLDYTGTHIAQEQVTLPRIWDVILAEFVGIFATRGSYQIEAASKTAAGISVRTYDEDLYARLARNITTIFGRPALERDTVGGMPGLFLHSTDAAGAFVQLMGQPLEARTVPSDIFTAPREIVAAFLRGAFEGRGSVRKGASIDITTVEHQLLVELRELLAMFGITSHIVSAGKDKVAHNESFHLRLVGTDSKQIFTEHIGFLSERLRAELYKRDERVFEIAASLALPQGVNMMAMKFPLYQANRHWHGHVPRTVIAFLKAFRSGRAAGITLPSARKCLKALDLVASIGTMPEAKGGGKRAGTMNPDPAMVARIGRFLREIVEGGYYEEIVERVEPVEDGRCLYIEVDGDQGFIVSGIVVADPPLVEVAQHTIEQNTLEENTIGQNTLEQNTSVVGAEDGLLHSGPLLAGGTVVNTQRGTVPIELVHPGDLIRTSSGPRHVLDVRSFSDTEMVSLEFSSGRTLHLSPDTLLRGHEGWIRSDACTPGVSVATSGSTGLFGNKIQLYLHYTADPNARRPSTVRLPTRWSVELAELFGYLLSQGRGTYDKYGRLSYLFVTVDRRDEDLAVAIIRIVQRQFAKTVWMHRHKKIHIGICSLDIGGMVTQLGMNLPLDGRALPRGITEAPKEIIAGLLRGYAENRSSFKNRQGSHRLLRIGSSSIGLAESMADLLANFGIVSTVVRRPTAEFKKHGFSEIQIRSCDSQRIFVEEIGFLSARRKTEALEILDGFADIAQDIDAGSDMLQVSTRLTLQPFQDSLMRRRKSFPPGSEERNALQVLVDYLRGRLTVDKYREEPRWMTRARMQWMADHVPSDLLERDVPYIAEALREAYSGILVNHVEPLEPTTGYQLVIEENVPIIANGVVVRGG